MDSLDKIALGLIGVGHLGRIHAKCLAELAEEITVVGVYDPDAAAATRVAEQHGLIAFDSLAALLEALATHGSPRAVDIVTPTTTHHDVALACLTAGCHVFVEKPIAATGQEARAIESLAAARGLTVQVGHVERFNPAFRHVAGHGIRPIFIEAHRLAQFNPRAHDVSVVLDLMIHDIDLVLSLVNAELESVSASGVGVVGETVDIANARLDFVDGTTANLTASRISLKSMRKLRFFAPEAYVGLDLLDKTAEIVQLGPHDPSAPGPLQLPTSSGLKEVLMTQPEIAPANAIVEELRAFARSLRSGTPAVVTAADGRRALELAERIIVDMAERHTRTAQQALRPS